MVDGLNDYRHAVDLAAVALEFFGENSEEYAAAQDMIRASIDKTKKSIQRLKSDFDEASGAITSVIDLSKNAHRHTRPFVLRRNKRVHRRVHGWNRDSLFGLICHDCRDDCPRCSAGTSSDRCRCNRPNVCWNHRRDKRDECRHRKGY